MAVNPVFNITIPQGADFSETFVSKESDGSLTPLAGFTGTARIKKHSAATTSTAFQVSIVTSTGEVSIAMTSGVTVRLEPGRYVYDVRLESPSGAVNRMVEGMAFVTAGITTT